MDDVEGRPHVQAIIELALTMAQSRFTEVKRVLDTFGPNVIEAHI